ncbi:C-terminal binding protein [Paenibacillus sp. GCM10027626]|uniref:C-terminal binding protein n=1 Tax=Paenibacillus sp. GCM10027626 TaxID=3273411 RepID=UPI00363A1AB9
MSCKVVVTDHGFPDLNIEKQVLADFDVELREYQCKSPDEVIHAAEHADAILTQWAPINADVVSSLQQCQAIVRYGIGVDNVDLEAAGARGIPVINVPDYALDEVADHAMALMISGARKLPQIRERINRGIWETNPCRPMYSLKGRVLGLAGFGNIARKVAARASAFGLQVIAYDPYVPEASFRSFNVRKTNWDSLLEQSDIISVHLPLTPDTKHLFRDEAFRRMKKGAFLVNTARGALVNTEDLILHLRSGHLSGAGLDVLEQEPVSAKSELLEVSTLVLTSHCAWYTEDALLRLKAFAAEEIARVFRGETPKHIANRQYLKNLSP